MNLAGARGEVGPKGFRSRVPKKRPVSEKIVGLNELHAVEEIIKFEAHVNLDVPVDLHKFVHHRVKVADARAAEVIAAQIASRAERRNREKCDRRAGLRSRVAARRDRHAGVQVWPRNQAPMLRVYGSKNVEG